MVKNKKTSKTKASLEPDSTFLLKIFLYFLLGMLWVKIDLPDDAAVEIISLPIGLLLGLYFAHHEHFQIDRKIEYVTLIIAMAISFVAPIGFVLSL